MADRVNQKLFAGHAVRRLRRRLGLSQLGMAEQLAISPSYLNLIERNQRALTGALLLRLTQEFGFDTRELGADPAGGVEGLRRRLADARFADLEIDRDEMSEWLAAAPRGAEAFARAFDAIGGGGGAAPESDAVAETRAVIERWKNHFAGLDEAAEALADELRLTGGDLYAALAERLRVKHSLHVRIMPVEVMPGLLRRLDMHARQLQLSELLDSASRTFAAAYHLAQIEARDAIEAIVRPADLSRPAERMFRRHLLGYFAAAVMMPYARFLRACEATGYDVELLQRRFGAGFEQIAHRLTTLGRVGARGLPFFLIRIDRAGQMSKRYAGLSASPLAGSEGLCPLWRAVAAFDRPGRLMRDLVELEDGSRWFTIARTVQPSIAREGGIRAEFAVVIGVAATQANVMAAARGIDVSGQGAPIGLGCADCSRPDCPQRSGPPHGRALQFSERERGLSAWTFEHD
ncbi:HTH cro/C1-type domain-containing protein [Sphingomonas antarctica]|uniref:helix-turn-helix domain-containing protein n=1 Tax=Sphingomonas antarctica TaxID=2040274 RepID=UPI0039EA0F79